MKSNVIVRFAIVIEGKSYPDGITIVPPNGANHREAFRNWEEVRADCLFDSVCAAEFLLHSWQVKLVFSAPETRQGELCRRLVEGKVVAVCDHNEVEEKAMVLFAVVSFESCCDDYYDAYQIVEGVFVSEKDAISHCMNSKEKVLYLFPVEAGKPWPTLPIENNPPSDLSWSCEEKRKLKELGAQAFFDGEAFNF